MSTKQEVNISENFLFEALPGPAAIVDCDGEIISTNKKWHSAKYKFQWLGEKPGADNYFTHCEQAIQSGNDYALKIVFGLRSVLDGEKESFQITVPCIAQNIKCWYKVTINSDGGNEGVALMMFEDVSKQMQSVQALRESEEIYSQHFKNSMAGIILGTPEGKIIEANPAACKILGYTRSELINGSRAMIVDASNPLNKNLYEVREKKSIYEGEKEYIHKNGSRITVEVSSLLYRNENGELRTINTFRDKSREKETLRELQNERRFTKAAINGIPNAFFVLDEKLKLLQWNDSFLEEMGYNEKTVLEDNVLEIITKKDRERVLRVVKDVFENGTGHTIAEIQTQGRGLRHYHFYANSFSSNGKKYLVGTGSDITDIIATEREKDRNYELISQLFESSPIGMLMISPENRVMKVNDSFSRVFGYEKIDIIGENVDKLIVPEADQDENEAFNREVFAGHILKKEAIRLTKDGRELNIVVNTVPIIESGKIVAAYGIYVDMTEQKQLEARIQQSLHEKEILLQEVHHRVKNNLAIIAGLLDLQILEEQDCMIENKLNEVRSRIFSIAKIHEGLYEKEDVVEIRFDEYLQNVAEALPQSNFSEQKDVEIEMDTEAVKLNLNQAVPCGLAINELMNIILAGEKLDGKLKIALKEEDKLVTIGISGSGIDVHRIEKEMSEGSFHTMLVDIFLSQIHGTLINGTLINRENGAYTLGFKFKKMNVRGSSSSVLNSRELISN
jgi:PAS domain S-box-containing protein